GGPLGTTPFLLTLLSLSKARRGANTRTNVDARAHQSHESVEPRFRNETLAIYKRAQRGRVCLPQKDRSNIVVVRQVHQECILVLRIDDGQRAVTPPVLQKIEGAPSSRIVSVDREPIVFRIAIR